jgi:hypothetical protein
LILFGMGFLAIGLYVRFGNFKTLYLTKGIPVLMPQALQNIFIPLGITLLIMALGLSDLVPTVELRQKFLVWGVGPIFLVSLILAVWNPRWLRPSWLNYLEDEYGTVMWKLLDEARKDVPAWSHRVRTQAGLEEWAEETRQKLGYPPHPGQIERQAKEREKKNRRVVR